MKTNSKHKDPRKSPSQQRTDHIEQQRSVNRLEAPGKTTEAISWTELLGAK